MRAEPAHGARAGADLPATVLRRLLDRAFLTPADAVDGGFAAVDVSMSHQCVLVHVAGHPRFFAKRGDPARSGRDLRVEARFHAQVGGRPELRDLVPQARLVAGDGSMIVMDAPDAAPLEVATLLCADGGRARAVVRRYGSALARVHAVDAPGFPPGAWSFEALEPRWGGHAALPEVCRPLFRRLAADLRYRAAFQYARALWTPTGLVHGDLRCANVLVERAGDPPRVWLVDWELACRGDRAWDVAAVIAELIAIALLWHPRPDPWSAVVESAAVFLDGYRGAWGAAGPALEALVRRAVPFAGVRLLQTLLEIGYAQPESLAPAERLLVPWMDELLAPAPALAAPLLDMTAGAAR